MTARAAAILALCFVFAAVPSAGDAQERRFVTSKGAAVPIPAPQALDCDGMRDVLDAIDATGYRRGGPAAVARGDRALLDYENALSSEHFKRCVEREALEAPPEAAFSGGYEREGEEGTER